MWLMKKNKPKAELDLLMALLIPCAANTSYHTCSPGKQRVPILMQQTLGAS